MTYINDEIHDVPHLLTVYPQRGTWDGPDFNADIRIAGIDFLSAASEEYPYQRQLTRVTKEQLDVSTEPGDQSLEGWWTISQTDWSGGSDQVYMEPASDELVKRMYYTSAGVDVFNDPGFFNLLPKSSEEFTGTGNAFIERLGGQNYVYAVDTTVYVVVDGATTTVDVGTEIVNLTVAGSIILVSTSDDTTHVHLPADYTTAAATITGYTGTPVLSYVKVRLLLAAGNKMWEIPDFENGADLSAATPVIEMPSTTAVLGNAIGLPQSILTYSNDGSNSTILSLTLDDTGSLPELSVPIEVGVLPSPESIRGLGVALGTYILILTSSGARVGTPSDAGLVYGPLIGAPAPAGHEDLPVVPESYDRFLSYPTADAGNGRAGDITIDLSVGDDDGRYAWSTFNRLDSGTGSHLDSIRLGARETVHAYLHGNGSTYIYHVSDENGLDEGWLHTSWIRFGTLESKYFDQVKVVCDPIMQGTVAVNAVDDEETATLIGTLNPNIGQEGTFKVMARDGTTDLALRFDLKPDSEDESLGPKVAAWSMRAWPAVKSRGEQVVLPLLCYDNESDSQGVNVGYQGYARERWDALTEQLTGGTSVLVVEFNSGFIYNAVAEDATFTQVAPGNNVSGFGGILQVVLRKT